MPRVSFAIPTTQETPLNLPECYTHNDSLSSHE